MPTPLPRCCCGSDCSPSALAPGLPSPSLRPLGRVRAELCRSYLKQAREEMGRRLVSKVYNEEGQPSKFWLVFAKRKFMKCAPLPASLPTSLSAHGSRASPREAPHKPLRTRLPPRASPALVAHAPPPLLTTPTHCGSPRRWPLPLVSHHVHTPSMARRRWRHLPCARVLVLALSLGLMAHLA